MRILSAFAAAAIAVMATGCASTSAGRPLAEDELVADPFEPFNRAMYGFNEGLDRVAIEPVAEVYGAVVPSFGRNRVRDFIDNLKTPVWFVNEVLQGDFAGAGDQARRFALNTTFGVAGVYDFASNVVGIDKHDEDFGQTLAVWGVGNGPYLVLPVLGPATARDLTGRAVDISFDPLTWSEFDGDDAFQVGRTAADIIDIRYRVDEAVELVRDGVDPYAQARALYIQSRNRRIYENGEGLPVYPDYPEYPEYPDYSEPSDATDASPEND